MSRFVHALPAGQTRAAAAAANGSTTVQDYLERIAKYVPAEIIATYVAVTSGFANTDEPLKYWCLLVSFLICWIFTPIYLQLMSSPADKDALRTQQIVSAIAFPIWAYSISGDSGLFGDPKLPIYHAEISTALILLFSLISGAIIPRKAAPAVVPVHAGS
ncbi:hypothetical protein [Dinghuibacter silviterrae]|uniref:Uncharacterized protein n=1 Tax=Dinghuibacter silviterrae TaxID=1539049 RepID=A0A4R8DXC9_9BACT|nr:hypothetical protein [Dinghuibacter silviterrae]TDX01871.1 hypothetical protein EDB95_2915 [Dinghuibacter silviterrae]